MSDINNTRNVQNLLAVTNKTKYWQCCEAAWTQ